MSPVNSDDRLNLSPQNKYRASDAVFYCFFLSLIFTDSAWVGLRVRVEGVCLRYCAVGLKFECSVNSTAWPCVDSVDYWYFLLSILRCVTDEDNSD